MFWDKVHIGADVVFLGIDVGLAFAAGGIAWLNVITDVLALASDIVQFVKDDSLADGNTANAQGAANWGGVLNALSLITNILNVGAQILSLGLDWGNLIKNAAKKGLEKVFSKLFGVAFSGVQVGFATSNMQINAIDSRELAVERMSVQELIAHGYPPSR